MTDRVSTTIEDGIAHVQLQRADKMNAIDADMFEALIAAGERIARTPEIRCVVLSGSGPAFCAGLDMSLFSTMEGGSDEIAESNGGLSERTHGIANRPQAAVWTWHTCPVPVIAALHGVAFGGGFQIALGCDLRIAHPETKLSIMEIKWGLIPDMAGTAILKDLMRTDVIRKLTYTGEIFSGTQALDYGAVTAVSETPVEEAFEIARKIASRSPSAIQAAKSIFNKIDEGMSNEEILYQESSVQDKIIGGQNQTEAVAAAIEKRAPVFLDER